MSTIEHDRVFGCALWRGALSADGYGRIDGRGAHRVLWEREHGQVPEGLVLDHLCRRRACVAAHHLEPVTPRENELRKSFSYRIKRRKCPMGHDLALTKIVTPEGPRKGEGGGVVCRQCNRDACAEKERHDGSSTTGAGADEQALE